MKKFVGVVLMLSLALAFMGCGSQAAANPAGQSGGMPEWVRKARRSAPEDVLVGIGSAKLATTNQSMNTSETRARAQIVRAMNSMVSNMIEDYTASSEMDPSVAVAFNQEITTSLARARLTGAVIEDQNVEPDGTWWTVIYLNKANVVNEINQAQAAAKLAVPAALAFNAESRMEEKFKAAATEDWVGNN